MAVPQALAIYNDPRYRDLAELGHTCAEYVHALDLDADRSFVALRRKVLSDQHITASSELGMTRDHRTRVGNAVGRKRENRRMPQAPHVYIDEAKSRGLLTALPPGPRLLDDQKRRGASQ